MRRISSLYWISLILWLTISGGFLLLNNHKNLLEPDDANILLGIIAVAVSIVSLGIATVKKPEFQGEISCWNVESKKQQVNNDSISPIGVYQCITFKIDNLINEPIQDLVINFRIQSSIINRRIELNDFYKSYEFKDTMLLTVNTIPFLGNNSGDNDVVFEHFLNLDKWALNRKLYVTISGSNIMPTTRSIDYRILEQIKQSNYKNPVILR